MQPSTQHRFLSSTVAAYASQFGRLLISFAAKLALARLVLPEGHGLYELALRIVTVAAACRDLGLPYQLMRDRRRPYGTVLASTLALGVLLTVFLLIVAPAFGFLTPELPQVLRVFAVWILLDALAVVPKAYFERELRLGRLLAPEIWRGLAMATVSVGLAWRGWGVWSFVVGDLVGTGLFAAFLWLRARGQIPLVAELRLLPDLVAKSSYLFLIWIAVQLVTYVDIYIIEIFGDTATVGHYVRAYMIAFLVSQIAAPRALFPALVEYGDDPERFAETFRLGTVMLITAQVIGGYFLFFNADKVVLVLLGANWQPAVALLRILAFVPFLDPFTKLGGELLKARHEDRLWLVIMLLNLVSLVTVGALLTARFGAEGMAAANFVLAGNLVMAWRIARVLGPRFRTLARDLALVYLAPLPLYLLAARLFPVATWSRFAASLVAALAAAGLLAARFRRPFQEFFR